MIFSWDGVYILRAPLIYTVAETLKKNAKESRHVVVVYVHKSLLQ